MGKLNRLREEMQKIEAKKDSFLGMDGGNINSKVWFCGIEFGGTLNKMENYYNGQILYNEENGAPFRESCSEYYKKSTFDRYLTVLYLALFYSEKVKLPMNSKKIDSALEKKLYNKNSNIFKLNLLPLAKPDTSWNKEITEKLGYDKEYYYGDLFQNRKVFINNLVENYKPKLIICSSTKDYEDMFVNTFFEPGENVDFKYEYVQSGNKSFKVSIYDKNITKIVIIPFLGRGNLASHQNVLDMSYYLKKYI